MRNRKARVVSVNAEPTVLGSSIHTTQPCIQYLSTAPAPRHLLTLSTPHHRTVASSKPALTPVCEAGSQHSRYKRVPYHPMIHLHLTCTASAAASDQAERGQRGSEYTYAHACLKHHRHQLPTRVFARAPSVPTNATIGKGRESAILSTASGSRGE